jgi:hypothetical protein
MLSFRQKCGFTATKSAGKPIMFERYTVAVEPIDYPDLPDASGNQDMDEGQIGARSAPRPQVNGWGPLLLVWFAGNVVVATLAWSLVSLLLK